MSRMPTLEGSARSKLNSLLTALRASGDTTELVKNRTKALLSYKPSGWDRDLWLREVLPEAWHANEAIASLGGSPGQGDHCAEDAASGADSASPPRRRHRGSQRGR
jgi:hypothetical protein